MLRNHRFFLRDITKRNIFSKNFKFFLFFSVLIILILVFWWQIANLQKTFEEFFFWKIISNQRISLGQADISGFLPIRKWGIEDLKINAQSAISVETNFSTKVLFKKNGDKKMPIASLTKLMTALVIFENPDKYNSSSFIKISEEAISQESRETKIKTEDVFSLENLLYLMLIESSNGAAYALSEVIGVENFVDLMNQKAKTLGLKNTYFGNPTGLDPKNPEEIISYSTAEDLAKLTDYLLKNHSQIWKITGLKEYTIYKPNGETIKLINTNKLLEEISEITGGKTGWTPEARGNLLLVMSNPSKTGFLIHIVLNSENRFEEAKNLIEWTKKAYKWR